MTVYAIIPARGGSKRLPRKNILPVLGQPMVAYSIQACMESKIFDEVIVSTEDAEIKKIAEQYGARVIDRPAEMATDTAHESLAYKHVIETLKAEGKDPQFFCGVYATALMLQASDLKDSYAVISDSDADVLMAVSEFPIHPYKALQKNDKGYYEMVHPVECKQRSQLYPDYVASNGTFYWFRVETFSKEANYYPEKLATYKIPFERAPDIDTQEDLDRAAALMQVLQKER